MSSIKPAAKSRRISAAEVALHNNQKSCWISIQRKVYDITTFLNKHPPGGSVLLRYAGLDASTAFLAVHHSSYAKNLMEAYYIGELEVAVAAVKENTGMPPMHTGMPTHVAMKQERRGTVPVVANSNKVSTATSTGIGPTKVSPATSTGVGLAKASPATSSGIGPAKASPATSTGIGPAKASPTTSTGIGPTSSASNSIPAKVSSTSSGTVLVRAPPTSSIIVEPTKADQSFSAFGFASVTAASNHVAVKQSAPKVSPPVSSGIGHSHLEISNLKVDTCLKTSNSRSSSAKNSPKSNVFAHDLHNLLGKNGASSAKTSPKLSRVMDPQSRLSTQQIKNTYSTNSAKASPKTSILPDPVLQAYSQLAINPYHTSKQEHVFASLDEKLQSLSKPASRRGSFTLSDNGQKVKPIQQQNTNLNPHAALAAHVSKLIHDSAEKHHGVSSTFGMSVPENNFYLPTKSSSRRGSFHISDNGGQSQMKMQAKLSELNEKRHQSTFGVVEDEFLPNKPMLPVKTHKFGQYVDDSELLPRNSLDKGVLDTVKDFFDF